MKLWSLQVLRFAAALGVVVFHAGWMAKNATGESGLVFQIGDGVGRAGVDVFFVLSGVIIATISRGMGPLDFAIKRLQRIYPVYLVLSLPWIAFAAIVGSLSWRNLLATVTLFPATDQLTQPLSPVAWTLCFEMLFYAGATLVLWRRWTAVVLVVVYLTALVVPVSALPQFIGSPLCLEFLAGVGLAQLPRSRWLLLALPVGVGLLVLGAVLPVEAQDAQLTASGFHDVWLRVMTLGVPATLIVLGTLQVKAKSGVLSYLGDASYSLYLIHPIILLLLGAIVSKYRPPVPVDVLALAGIALCVLAGWRIHEAVEKPLLNAFRKPLAPARAAA